MGECINQITYTIAQIWFKNIREDAKLGNKIIRANGVGFPLNKSVSRYVTAYHGYLDRLATLTLQAKSNKFNLTQVYRTPNLQEWIK